MTFTIHITAVHTMTSLHIRYSQRPCLPEQSVVHWSHWVRAVLVWNNRPPWGQAACLLPRYWTQIPTCACCFNGQLDHTNEPWLASSGHTWECRQVGESPLVTVSRPVPRCCFWRAVPTLPRSDSVGEDHQSEATWIKIYLSTKGVCSYVSYWCSLEANG